VAGLAAGLALGTKLTMAAAVIALTVGVIVLARGARTRTAAIWVASVLATGGYWFVRNMGHASGNPFPWLAHNISFLPGPDRGLEGRDPFTVAHYLFKLDGHAVGTYFIPDLHGVIGPLWPLVLALAAGGMLAALLRGRTPTVRMLGAVALAGAIAYLFTPLTASGPEGQPDGFAINLRYLAPALALGIVLLPLDRRLEDPRWRIGAFGVLAAALLTVAVYSGAKLAWQADAASKPAAILIGLFVVGVPVGIALLAGRSRPLALGAAAAAALVVLGVGWARQDNYLDARYEGPFRFHLETAFRWANGVEDARIGVGGTSGAFQQYGLYGRDVSNHVQYVGRPGPDGDFRRIDSCPEWRTAVNDGDYDYLVTTPRLDLNNAAIASASPEAGWANGDPALRRIAGDARIEIFRVEGELNPAGCGKRS
jgi:ABC-type amino acid transport system permease subunit